MEEATGQTANSIAYATPTVYLHKGWKYEGCGVSLSQMYLTLQPLQRQHMIHIKMKLFTFQTPACM